MFEGERARFLGRLRYDPGEGSAKRYRHGHRERQFTGNFWTGTVRVPRACTRPDPSHCNSARITDAIERLNE